MEFSFGHKRPHAPNTHSACPSRPERCTQVKCKSAPFSLCPSILFSRQSHAALNALRWPSTTHTQPPSHPTTPVHSRVVTQQSSWLVMEPVSHPASINLTPPHTPLSPARTPALRLTKWLRESIGGSGLAGGGVGCVLVWASSQIRTVFHPHSAEALRLPRTHTDAGGVVCKLIYRCTSAQTHTHGCSHMAWSSHTIGISTMASMWDFTVSVIVAVLILHHCMGGVFLMD